MLHIDSKDQMDRYRKFTLSHLLIINNPGAKTVVADWFLGERLDLVFGDVTSVADARRCNTKAPTLSDVDQAVQFIEAALLNPQTSILIACDYGASRSPAVAYVGLAKHLGPGKEEDALSHVLKIRPEAVPNKFIVALGDELLDRQGALMLPLEALYLALDKEIQQALREEP